MGEIFLFLALSIGGEVYGPEVIPMPDAATCHKQAVEQLQIAQHIAMLAAPYAVKASAECLTVEELEDRGVKVI